MLHAPPSSAFPPLRVVTLILTVGLGVLLNRIGVFARPRKVKYFPSRSRRSDAAVSSGAWRERRLCKCFPNDPGWNRWKPHNTGAKLCMVTAGAKCVGHVAVRIFPGTGWVFAFGGGPTVTLPSVTGADEKNSLTYHPLKSMWPYTTTLSVPYTPYVDGFRKSPYRFSSPP